jgi:hypothetical protein
MDFLFSTYVRCVECNMSVIQAVQYSSFALFLFQIEIFSFLRHPGPWQESAATCIHARH